MLCWKESTLLMFCSILDLCQQEVSSTPPPLFCSKNVPRLFQKFSNRSGSSTLSLLEKLLLNINLIFLSIMCIILSTLSNFTFVPVRKSFIQYTILQEIQWRLNMENLAPMFFWRHRPMEPRLTSHTMQMRRIGWICNVALIPCQDYRPSNTPGFMQC